MEVRLVFIVSSIALILYGYRQPNILTVLVTFFFGAYATLKELSGISGGSLLIKYLILMAVILLYKMRGFNIGRAAQKVLQSRFFVGYSILLIFNVVRMTTFGHASVDDWMYIRSMLIYNLVPMGMLIAYYNNTSEIDYFNKHFMFMMLMYTYVFYRFGDTSAVVIGDRMTLHEVGIHSTIGLSRLGIIGFICSIMIYVYGDSRKSKILHTIPIFISIFVVLISAQRGPILGLLFALLFWFIYKVKNKNILTIFAVAILVAIILLGMNIEQFGVIDRFKDLENYREYQRFFDYSMSYELWKKSPIFGHGINGYYYLTGRVYPHNMFLEVLVEHGLFGLIVLLFMLSESINSVFLILKDDNASYGELTVALSWIAMFFAVLVSGSLSGNNAFFAISGLTGSIAAIRLKDFSNSMQRKHCLIN